MLAGILRRVGRRLLASIPALFGVIVVTFVLRRLALLGVVMAAVSVLTFGIVNVLPGEMELPRH